MIHQAFPDIAWLKAQIKNRFENQRNYLGEKLPAKGFPSVIINAKITDHAREEIVGPLSVFYNLKGTSKCEVDGRVITIPRGYFFVSNNKQSYSLYYDKEEKVETFNIHLGEEFSKNYFDDKEALEKSNSAEFSDFFIRNRLYPVDATFITIINRFKQTQINKIYHEEVLQQLLQYLIGLEQQNIAQSFNLSLKRKPTKEEVYKRMVTSIDYLYENFEQIETIDELAEIACISKFHYLRLFKEVFNTTPYKFIQELKIKKAKEILTASSASIAEVAIDLGFESTSAFDKFFKRHTGQTPTDLLK